MSYGPQPQRNSPIKWIAVGALLLVLFLFVIGVAGYWFNGGGGGGPIPQSHTANIVNGLITVNAGSYEYYPMTIPSSAYSVSLSGSFTASGGSGNDIYVYVMDSTNFVNWQNGHTANTYYNSGQVTTGTVSASLPSGSGTYYLVYDNSFSSFTQKNVQTIVNLVYTT